MNFSLCPKIKATLLKIDPQAKVPGTEETPEDALAKTAGKK